MSTPDRWITALLIPFGVENAVDDRVYRPADFFAWVASGQTAPMRWQHEGAFDPRGQVGTWRAFAIYSGSDIPAGLLGFGDLAMSPAGQAALDELTAPPQPWWGVSAAVLDGPGGVGVVEASLTPDPAFDAARVIAVGESAARAWELLTGMPAPTLTEVGSVVRTGRVLGITGDGRVIREQWEESF